MERSPTERPACIHLSLSLRPFACVRACVWAAATLFANRRQLWRGPLSQRFAAGKHHGAGPRGTLLLIRPSERGIVGNQPQRISLASPVSATSSTSSDSERSRRQRRTPTVENTRDALFVSAPLLICSVRASSLAEQALLVVNEFVYFLPSLAPAWEKFGRVDTA